MTSPLVVQMPVPCFMTRSAVFQRGGLRDPSPSCTVTVARERQAHASTDVQHAELLERWLMEGAYNKVLAARDSMPDPAYAYFMQRLLSTVRCGPWPCMQLHDPGLLWPM